MPDPTPLITLARARQSPLLAPLDDPTLNSMIVEATDAIESYCNRHFALAERVEQYNGHRDDRDLLLRAFPIVAVTSIVVDTAFDTNLPIEAATIPITDVVVTPRLGVVSIIPRALGYWRYWPEGPHELITVTYTGGFDVVPAAVRQACVQQMIWMRTNEITDPSMSSEKLGAYAVTQARTRDTEGAGLPDNVRMAVSRYKDRYV